jgi:hypothetical protein
MGFFVWRALTLAGLLLTVCRQNAASESAASTLPIRPTPRLPVSSLRGAQLSVNVPSKTWRAGPIIAMRSPGSPTRISSGPPGS